MYIKIYFEDSYYSVFNCDEKGDVIKDNSDTSQDLKSMIEKHGNITRFLVMIGV